jgi:subtilisin family serine protease
VAVAAVVDRNGGAPGGLEVATWPAASAGAAARLVDDLRDRPEVVAADVDRPVRLLPGAETAPTPAAARRPSEAAAQAQAQAPSDPKVANQWGLARLDAGGAWATSTGAGTVVAVLDTGVRVDHEDLAGRLLPGRDLVPPLPGDGSVRAVVDDPHGHGTHVAGVVVAAAGNGVGGAGLAPGATVLPVRVLGADGSGSLADVAAGVLWAAEQGADVITMSLGASTRSPLLAAAIDHAVHERDIVVVVAAGNCGDPLTASANHCLAVDASSYPAAHPDVLAVAATKDADRIAPWVDERAAFSSQNADVDVAAPGASILSTCRGTAQEYCWMSGTSMATPFVAAGAALVRAAHPDLGAGAVRDLLLDTAVDVGAPGRDDAFGAGVLDPVAALAAADAAPGPTDPPPVDPTPVDPGPTDPPPVGPSPIDPTPVEPPPVPPPPVAPPPVVPPATPPAPRPALERGRLWLADPSGAVRAAGAAPSLGDVAHLPLRRPVVGLTPTATADGYWLVASDGGVFSFGDAAFHGSTGALDLARPIVGLAPTPTGAGYWMVAADGGVFAFGDAPFHGSTGGLALRRPIVAMASTATGAGYWLVASDGGVFAFGDAAFHGSTGALDLAQPIVGLAATPAGHGYWMVAADGGVFTFGDAPFLGSAVGRVAAPAVGVVATAGGDGYWVVTADARALPFGAAGPLPA